MSEDTATQEPKASPGRPESFPKPRTIPANWDLSTLSTVDLEANSIRKPGLGNSEQEASATANNGRAGAPNQLEKPSEAFPQPRTFPGNWDLSD